MNWLQSFLEGAVSGLGMWLMMTVLGLLSFFALRRAFTKWLAKLMTDVKTEAVKLNGLTIEGKLKTKKTRNIKRKKKETE